MKVRKIRKQPSNYKVQTHCSGISHFSSNPKAETVNQEDLYTWKQKSFPFLLQGGNFMVTASILVTLAVTHLFSISHIQTQMGWAKNFWVCFLPLGYPTARKGVTWTQVLNPDIIN